MIRLAKILFLTGALSYLGFTLNQFYTVVHFYTNQEKIAATLCINKEVENSSCHGHCQLKAELNVPADNQITSEINQSLRSALIVFQASQIIEKFEFNTQTDQNSEAELPAYLALHSDKVASNLLDPPERIV